MRELEKDSSAVDCWGMAFVRCKWSEYRARSIRECAQRDSDRDCGGERTTVYAVMSE